MFAGTVSRHGARPALALIGETPLTYNEVEQKVSGISQMLAEIGFRAGDRAAILSANLPNWPLSFYGITFMGGIAVPVLPDFHPSEIETILHHSGARVLFVSEALRKRIQDIDLPRCMTVLSIEDFSMVRPPVSKTECNPALAAPANPDVKEDDIASIIYTSGTMGKSKGVMLTHKNLVFTALASGKVQEVHERDRFLSILPLSHTYENTIGMILPMLKGAAVYYLGKAPTPSILLPAMAQVRPTLVLSVPLIIEKIYRSSVEAKFAKSTVMRQLVQFSATRKFLHRMAGDKLKKAFGGELKFFGIGGAKLNRDVEQFLIDAKFPYAIGYGLTESSPLLAGFNPQNYRLQTTGRAIEGIELIINDPDPATGEGEIWARGPNVMKGYYREPELTKEILTEDGWLKTGDLGVFEPDGYLSIRGRLKNMIVLSSGENVYPEEIESVINNFRHVLDSLVLEKKGKLVALVHFNREEIESHYSRTRQEVVGFVEKVIEELRHELMDYVNRRVNKFSQVHTVIVLVQPFEKTATMKIKRYLYGASTI